MKRAITILLMLSLLQLNAQSSEKETEKQGNYIFTKAFQTTKVYNFSGEEISDEVIIHKPGSKFSIVNSDSDNYIIQYWNWDENVGDKSLTKKQLQEKAEAVILNDTYFRIPDDGIDNTLKIIQDYLNQIDIEDYDNDSINEALVTYNTNYKYDSYISGKKNGEKLKYFKISKKDFNKVCTKYFNRWLPVTAGIYSIPFKIRPKNFEFEQDLNLGVSLGFPFRIFKTSETKWIVEPNIGIGITKINLNSKNTDSIVTTERTANALTLSSGVLLRFSEKINLGLFGGWDFLSKTNKDTNWIYDRKLWIGVGINISFNSSGEKRESKGNNKGIKEGD